MRVKKHIEAGEIESLVELSGDAACLGAPVADEEASLLPKQAESFERTRRKALEVSSALCQRATIQMSNFQRYETPEIREAFHDRDYQNPVSKHLI